MALFNRKKSTTPATSAPAATSPAAAPVAVLDRDAFGAATQAVGHVAGNSTSTSPPARSGSPPATPWSPRSAARFTDFAGESSTIDTAAPARSSVTLTIQAASVDTGQEAARRPPAAPATSSTSRPTRPSRFVSTQVSRPEADLWSIAGDLTIDVTRPVTVEFEQTGSAKDPSGDLRVGFEGSTTINRADWA